MRGDPRVEPIDPREIPQILDLKWSVFGPFYESRAVCDDYTIACVDWTLSVKLTYEDEIVGMYLLQSQPVSDAIAQEGITTLHEGLERYSALRGLHGVTLAIHPAFRGRGWGNMLKEHATTLGYDYWWAVAFKTLGNLEDWEKRARLVGESQEVYLLLEDFT